MNKPKSPVRELFDKAERKIGEPLEEIVASRTYTDLMLALSKIKGKVGGTIADTASGAVEKVLHVAQIPTRSDVRRLNRQIVELATEVRSLSHKLQEARRRAGADGERQSVTRKSPGSRKKPVAKKPVAKKRKKTTRRD